MKHRLTHRDLTLSSNAIIQDSFVLSADLRAAKSPGGQLYADYKRESVRFGLKQESVQGADASLEEFDRKLSALFSEDQQRDIKKHYSQNMMRCLPIALDQPVIELIPSIRLQQPEKGDVSQSIYIDNDEVYCKVSIQQFPLYNIDTQKKMGFLSGPIEAVFQLTDAGFSLSYIDTNSDVMANRVKGVDPDVENPTQHFLDSVKKESDLISEAHHYEAVCEGYLSYLVEQMGEDRSNESLKNISKKIQVVSIALGELKDKGSCIEDRKAFFIKKTNDPDFKKILKVEDDVRAARFFSDVEKVKKLFSREKNVASSAGFFSMAAKKLKTMIHSPSAHHSIQKNTKRGSV